VLGSALDKAIELTLRERWAATVPQGSAACEGADVPAISAESLRERYEDAWDVLLGEDEPIDWGRESPSSVFEDGQTIVSAPAVLRALNGFRLASARSVGIDRDGPALQLPIRLHVPGVPVPVIGYIDAVAADPDQRQFVIVDFKVSRRRWPPGKARTELQPRVYTAALRQAGLPLSALRFQYLIITRAPLPDAVGVHELPAGIDERDLYATLDLLKDAWRQIISGVFPPNPSSWRCGAGCPEWDAGRCLAAGLGPRPTPEQGLPIFWREGR
jgi:hypothetical protein